MSDPFQILGLSPWSTEAEVRSTYKRLALQNHPDKVGEAGLEKMKTINVAYRHIMDNKLYRDGKNFKAPSSAPPSRPQPRAQPQPQPKPEFRIPKQQRQRQYAGPELRIPRVPVWDKKSDVEYARGAMPRDIDFNVGLRITLSCITWTGWAICSLFFHIILSLLAS